MARVQDLHAIPAEQRRAAGPTAHGMGGSGVDDQPRGKDYDSRFGSRMKGAGIWSDLLRQRFETSCRKLGLNQTRTALDLGQFRPGLLRGQASLF